MRALSIKQPWATLLMLGHKQYETRSWPAPGHLVGQRIAICASKKNEVATLARATGIEPLIESVKAQMHFGKVLGTMLLAKSEAMTPEFIAAASEQERSMGDFTIGSYAWSFIEPELFAEPPAVSGKLGFFEWEGL